MTELQEPETPAPASEPTDTEREAQRRSFAFGNQKIHKPDTARADIDRAAERLAEQEPTDAK